MKILLLVTGVGYGDSTREEANINELMKQDPKTRIVVAGYDNSYRYFRGKLPVIKIKGYRLPGTKLKFNVLPFLFYNYFLPFIWVFFALKIRRAVKAFKPDVIISDFEPTGIALAKLVRKKCIVIFGYDPELYKEYASRRRLSWKTRVEAWYFEQIYKKADHVIIPSFFPEKIKDNLSGNKGIEEQKFSRVHITVRKNPRELSSKNVLMKKLGLKKQPIIMMMGGSEFGYSLAKKVRKLAGTFGEEFIAFGGRKNLRPAKNFRHHRFKENFLEYLKVSKGVITLAGQKTLAECAIFKKPMLIFPIKHHVEQEINAYSLRKYTMVGYAESLKDKNLENLLRLFIVRLPELKLKIEQAKIIDGGSKEVAAIVRTFLLQRTKH